MYRRKDGSGEGWKVEREKKTRGGGGIMKEEEEE